MFKYAATALSNGAANAGNGTPIDESIQNRSRLRSLMQMRPNQCKWPVSVDRAQIGHVLFCCLPVDRTSSYCSHHHQMAIAIPVKATYRRQAVARR